MFHRNAAITVAMESPDESISVVPRVQAARKLHLRYPQLSSFAKVQHLRATSTETELAIFGVGGISKWWMGWHRYKVCEK